MLWDYPIMVLCTVLQRCWEQDGLVSSSHSLGVPSFFRQLCILELWWCPSWLAHFKDIGPRASFFFPSQPLVQWLLEKQNSFIQFLHFLTAFGIVIVKKNGILSFNSFISSRPPVQWLLKKRNSFIQFLHFLTASGTVMVREKLHFQIPIPAPFLR